MNSPSSAVILRGVAESTSAIDPATTQSLAQDDGQGSQSLVHDDILKIKQIATINTSRRNPK